MTDTIKARERVEADNQFLVWWLSESEYQQIGSRTQTPKRYAPWPSYLTEQYHAREGRPGNGRLWVAKQFGEVGIDPWPDTPLAKRLGVSYGGIVIQWSDQHHIQRLAGIVTDLSLNRIPRRRLQKQEPLSPKPLGARERLLHETRRAGPFPTAHVRKDDLRLLLSRLDELPRIAEISATCSERKLMTDKTASDLADELEGLAEKATKGEWANGLDDLDCVWSRQPSNDGNVVCLPPETQMELSLERWPANAALIVALRNNLPLILSALRRVEVMEKALKRLADAADFYGINYLDTDDLDEVAIELQEATLAARQALTGEA